MRMVGMDREGNDTGGIIDWGAQFRADGFSRRLDSISELLYLVFHLLSLPRFWQEPAALLRDTYTSSSSYVVFKVLLTE